MKIWKQFWKVSIFIIGVLLLGLTMGVSAEYFTTLPTINTNLYQFVIKLVDFPNNAFEDYFLIDSSKSHGNKAFPGLVSGYLGEDNYPTNQKKISMSDLFAGSLPINHMFLESRDGIWEFDSTQCFAFLHEDSFILYRELGTIDIDYTTTMDHGQFLPFNSIKPGILSTFHPTNEYDALGNELPDNDLRKGEPLYAIQANEANHYFGLTIDATFTCPSSGKDERGEDLIAYFTADDDLWVYIDGYLILDLGGIHSAIPGSINFSTGAVTYRDADGKDYTTKLYKLFTQRYREQHPEAREGDVQAFIDDLFKENNQWQMVLRDDIIHTIKIIYLERGAGASNLCIRFNLPILKKQ